MQQFLRLILLTGALGLAPAGAQQRDATPAPADPGAEGQPVAPEAQPARPIRRGAVKVKSQQEKQALAQACMVSGGTAEACNQLGR